MTIDFAFVCLRFDLRNSMWNVISLYMDCSYRKQMFGASMLNLVLFWRNIRMARIG